MNPDNVINLFHKEPKQTHHEEYTKFLGEIDDCHTDHEVRQWAMDMIQRTVKCRITLV